MISTFLALISRAIIRLPFPSLISPSALKVVKSLYGEGVWPLVVERSHAFFLYSPAFVFVFQMFFLHHYSFLFQILAYDGILLFTLVER